jgi:hypothetical protein
MQDNPVVAAPRDEQPPPITDSPWLWFALFSAVGLTMLLVTGGKFGDRQAQIERKGQAQGAAASTLVITEDATGRKTAENAPEYSRPGNTEIRLLPLSLTIGAVLVGSLVMLARERLRLRARE